MCVRGILAVFSPSPCEHTLTKIHASVSQMQPELWGSKPEPNWSCFDTHIDMRQCQHTNTHNNNIFTQWSWISKKVLADIPTEVKMFYLLLFSLQTQAYTPMHRKINTHSGFVTFEDTEHSFLWGSPLTLKSATIGHSEAQPRQSPPSRKYTNKNKGMSRDCPQKYS